MTDDETRAASIRRQMDEQVSGVAEVDGESVRVFRGPKLSLNLDDPQVVAAAFAAMGARPQEHRPAACPNCLDSGHVCESHPNRPWGGMCCGYRQPGLCEYGACHCGGAGVPCPSCCNPIPQDGICSIAEAFTPRHLRQHTTGDPS